MVICWERAVFLAFRLWCFTLCRLNCLCSLPVWCLGQDVEFDCIGSWLLRFHLLYFFLLFLSVPEDGCDLHFLEILSLFPFFFVDLGFTVHQDYFTRFEPSQSLRGAKRKISEKKTTWPLASSTWLVSHMTRTRLEPTTVRWRAI